LAKRAHKLFPFEDLASSGFNHLSPSDRNASRRVDPSFRVQSLPLVPYWLSTPATNFCGSLADPLFLAVFAAKICRGFHLDLPLIPLIPRSEYDLKWSHSPTDN
jgi:hypothetical protein